MSHGYAMPATAPGRPPEARTPRPAAPPSTSAPGAPPWLAVGPHLPTPKHGCAARRDLEAALVALADQVATFGLDGCREWRAAVDVLARVRRPGSCACEDAK